MPNYFTLTLKGQTTPSPMTYVDEALCKHLGVEVHPVRYVEGWFNTIGLSLACGKDWDWLRNQYKDYPKDLDIIDYLEANYTLDAWAGR